MIEKKYVSSSGSDQNSNYEIIMDKEITVGELVRELIKDEFERGTMIIRGVSSYEDAPKCEFKKGIIFSRFSKEYNDRIVAKATSNGGWGYMSYELYLK